MKRRRRSAETQKKNERNALKSYNVYKMPHEQKMFIRRTEREIEVW